MVRDPFGEEPTPPLQDLLDALSDPGCREIVRAIDEPMTANEVSEKCDIPQSTTYRKLDLLSEATLLTETTAIRQDGRHTTRYEVAFQDIHVSLDEHREFQIEITRPPRSTEEHLADMWSEVQKEL